MAKGKNTRHSSAVSRAGRGLSNTHSTANTVVLPRPAPSLLPMVSPPVRVQVAPAVDDRRRFHPEGSDRPPLTKWGTLARSVVVNRPVSRPAAAKRPLVARRFPNRPSQTKAVQTFVQPETVMACIRRNLRREVMFALGGAGKRKMRRPKRNWLSKISCRR